MSEADAANNDKTPDSGSPAVVDGSSEESADAQNRFVESASPPPPPPPAAVEMTPYPPARPVASPLLRQQQQQQQQQQQGAGSGSAGRKKSPASAGQVAGAGELGLLMQPPLSYYPPAPNGSTAARYATDGDGSSIDALGGQLAAMNLHYAAASPPPPPPPPSAAGSGTLVANPSGGLEWVPAAAAVGPDGMPVPGVVGVGGFLHPQGEHPSRTLFVRNIDLHADDSTLFYLFQEFGPIRTFFTRCKHRGFVMVSYFDIRHAKAALRELQGRVVAQRRLDIHYSIPKDNPQGLDANQGTLVVFNLADTVSNDQLRAIFGAFGEIKEIRETPHKKHHKFVEFFDVRDAEKAMRLLNKTEIHGKHIKIEVSRPGGIRNRLSNAAASMAAAGYRFPGGSLAGPGLLPSGGVIDPSSAAGMYHAAAAAAAVSPIYASHHPAAALQHVHDGRAGLLPTQAAADALYGGGPVSYGIYGGWGYQQPPHQVASAAAYSPPYLTYHAASSTGYHHQHHHHQSFPDNDVDPQQQQQQAASASSLAAPNAAHTAGPHGGMYYTPVYYAAAPAAAATSSPLLGSPSANRSYRN